jgi:hypothetical protein
MRQIRWWSGVYCEDVWDWHFQYRVRRWGVGCFIYDHEGD